MSCGIRCQSRCACRQRLARIEALQQRKAAARAAAAGAPPGAVTISEEAGPSSGGGGSSKAATAAAASTADPAGGIIMAQGGDAPMPAVDLEPEALVSVDAIVAAAAQQQAQVCGSSHSIRQRRHQHGPAANRGRCRMEQCMEQRLELRYWLSLRRGRW